MSNEIGKIVININEDSVTWETEMEIPEVIFWLETTKAMVINRTIFSDSKVES
jgi:hypothetical protein